MRLRLLEKNPVRINTSIIPSKERMVAEYKEHVRECEWYESDGQLDELYRSDKEIRLDNWHEQEMLKLEKVLDALYLGWNE